MKASAVIMVRPWGGAWNPETAVDNAFQGAPEGLTAEAMVAEFDAAVAALRQTGLRVDVVEGAPNLPDAVFPNNWFSTHADGRAVLYPMAHPSRRAERSLWPSVQAFLAPHDVVDLSAWEADGLFMEGTGSLVLDHERKIAYAALSPRTHPDALALWCARMGYVGVPFETHGDIYHTNVLMAMLGADRVLLCEEVIREPNRVKAELRASGREILPISRAQMNTFGGNILDLATGLVMSESAAKALGGLLEPDAVIPIPTIEQAGGGSLRCMLAENFLPN